MTARWTAWSIDLSISRQHRTLGTRRCSSTEARWVLVQFGVEGALEDNRVPGGLVRNFWRPVADHLVGRDCLCVADDAIREDKGDFVWRAAFGLTVRGVYSRRRDFNLAPRFIVAARTGGSP